MKVKTEAKTAEEMRDIIVKWHRQQAARALNAIRTKRLKREQDQLRNEASVHNDSADFIEGIEVIQ